MRTLLNPETKLEIVQAGDPVLRQIARPLRADEIQSAEIQQTIADMLETLRLAPGVGLAAPQIGLGVQLAIIEDRAEYQSSWSAEQLHARGRAPVDFHVSSIQSWKSTADAQPNSSKAASVSPATPPIVPRATRVRVRYLDQHGDKQQVEAHGWYARILQHEIDHLNGTLYHRPHEAAHLHVRKKLPGSLAQCRRRSPPHLRQMKRRD